MEIDDLPGMLRIDEAAELLRVSKSHVYAVVAEYERTEGESGLPAIRVGHAIRVPREALREWIEASLRARDDGHRTPEAATRLSAVSTSQLSRGTTARTM